MILAALLYAAGIGLMSAGFEMVAEKEKGVYPPFAVISTFLWPFIGLFLAGMQIARYMKGK